MVKWKRPPNMTDTVALVTWEMWISVSSLSGHKD